MNFWKYEIGPLVYLMCCYYSVAYRYKNNTITIYVRGDAILYETLRPGDVDLRPGQRNTIKNYNDIIL